MALDLRQSLKLSQQLLMTPQLQQAIKLLQLSRIELEQFVSQQLSENPCLEEGDFESVEEKDLSEKMMERSGEDLLKEQLAQGAEGIVDKVSEERDVDWEALSRIKEAAELPAGHKTSHTAGEEAPNYENMVSSSETLVDYLSAQLSELGFDDEEQKVAVEIVGNISEKGYLDATIEGISERTGVEIEVCEGVLDSIQRLDPPGIGARSLEECLLNQLRTHGLRNEIVESIIRKCMTELETRNFNQIAKNLKITLEQVIENVAIIAELDPIPARQFGGENSHYVVPDVYIFPLGDEWVVTMNEEGLPRLRVSDYYSEVADNTKGDDKEYLQEKIKSAAWLIKSIQQRQRTIFKVTECIVERQKDFFERGVEHLKPMILKDIAEDISMHESTISRVTNNKYVHTPRGIFELKYFFNSSVARGDGSDMASESVKVMIKQIVDGEDPKKPLSDQKIVDALKEKSITLARRTVAKYREQLGILPSSKRKRYF